MLVNDILHINDLLISKGLRFQIKGWNNYVALLPIELDIGLLKIVLFDLNLQLCEVIIEVLKMLIKLLKMRDLSVINELGAVRLVILEELWYVSLKLPLKHSYLIVKS